ncbi:MAG: alpha-L-arabinofuranosidase, partial [Actinomycetes bacterium]|nr:alpha-L-arabinofuranosidase [Actinomycetes bacterium]
AYYWEEDGDLASFLASAVDMDRFVAGVSATADAVRAARKATKRIHISFDEWNVWYVHRAESQPPTGDDWPVAPVLLEDRYTVADAVVVGSLLISLLRNTDRVHAASLAQLVNVIAPIMTEPGGRAWRQTTFHPFAQASSLAVGEVLQVVIDSPTHATAKFGDVTDIDAVATVDDASGETVVFLVNRSAAEEVTVEVEVRSFGAGRLLAATTLHSTDHTWTATADDDSSVGPRPNATARVDGGRVNAVVPPVSWSVLRLGR